MTQAEFKRAFDEEKTFEDKKQILRRLNIYLKELKSHKDYKIPDDDRFEKWT